MPHLLFTKPVHVQYSHLFHDGAFTRLTSTCKKKVKERMRRICKSAQVSKYLNPIYPNHSSKKF